jgi:hypothetical protein
VLRNSHQGTFVDFEISGIEAPMNPDTRAPEYQDADRKAPTTAQNQTIVPTTRVRQGVTGHNVRYVLAFGIAAVIVAFVIVYLTYV